MNVERTVDFQLEFNRLHELVDSKALFQALGYITTWGLDSPLYTHLTVTQSDGPHLVAYYATNATAAPSFVLGAVWREGERQYSFHS